MTAILLALLAGSLTVINPCVLPILPFVLLGALQQHRYGPLALAGGLAAGFTLLGLLVYGAGAAFDLSSEAARQASAILLLGFGIVMLSSRLKDRLAAAGSGWTGPLNRLLDRATPTGLGGQFAAGALLGGIWSPCSGPTLGAAVTLAAQSTAVPRAAAIMLFFGIGAALPMLALAYGSRRALQSRREMFGRISRAAMPIMGVFLVASALFVLTGIDKRAEAALIDVLPEWLLRLTTRF